MEKLNQLLVGRPFAEFGAAFAAATDDSGIEVSPSEASFWLEGGVAPAGAGFVWGHGEVNYQGRDHAFTLSGLSIANVDAVPIYASGTVMHLKTLADFDGNYLGTSVGSIGAELGAGTYLKNKHGVVIKLIAMDAGHRITLSVSGVRVRLKRRCLGP